MGYYKRILQKIPIYSTVHSRLQQDDQESLYGTVMLPVLTEFVSWVLDEAVKSGKERLYFLARDGWQMYLAAKELCRIRQISIDCRYLKVSRYAMRQPEYHLLKERCVDYICIGGIDVTAERIMKRAGLSEERAKVYLSDLDSKRILNYQEVVSLKDKLIQNKAFLEEVYIHSRKAYAPAIGYLRQEGLFEDVSYALADSGWIGTLQQTISHLTNRSDIEGYYFGLYEIPKGISENLYHTFYFGPKWGLRQKVHFSNCLFEAIFTSSEGMTLCYEEQNEIYVPVADFMENPNREQIEKNCQILERYWNVYESVIEEVFAEVSDKTRKTFVRKLLKQLMGNPANLEIGQYGDLLFSDDVLEGNLKKVAADLTEEEIRQQHFFHKTMIMLGIKKTEIHESAWIEGSIRKEGHHVQYNLFHARLYKSFIYLRKLVTSWYRSLR